MVSPIFFWLLLAAPPAASAADQPKVVWSGELGLKALDAVDAALAAPFPDQADWEVSLPEGGKRVLKTCREFLAVSKGKFDAGTEQDWITLQAAGARCLALESLKDAKPPARTFFDWFTFSSRGIGELPAGLSMLDSPESVSDAKRAEKVCRPWGKYDPTLKIKVETPDKARLRTEGWTGRLVLYARADFDGDGIEDLLLRRDAHVTGGGSAADASVFIVTQTSAKPCPRLVRALGNPR